MTPVSELLAMKIEISVLRLQQLQALVQAGDDAAKALIEQARAEVKAPATHLYNVETRVFQPPEGAKPLSTTYARQKKRAAHGRG